MFIMRLSASGRSYARAYLNEAQGVFLDGHVRAFDHFGGMPRRIRYDNLKAAVERVLKGRDRIESERFIALRSHYGDFQQSKRRAIARPLGVSVITASDAATWLVTA